MKNLKKNIQNVFKIFFYKIFSLFHGKIKGKISSKNDPRIETKIVEKGDNLKYKIYKIKDGRLYTDRIHDAAVILDNFIIEGPSYQLRPINNEAVEKNIVFKKGTPRVKKNLKGKVLSLLTGGAGNNNYFHWLFDVLPRLTLCEKVIDLNEIDYFLLPNTEKKYQTETLSLLNIPYKKQISSKYFRHINATEIFVTEHPYVITNDASHDIQNIPIWISKWLKKKCLDNIDNNKFEFSKKIYIARKVSNTNVNNLRSIINENEVSNFLKSLGFKSIILEDIDFKDQVKIFNNAEIIAGLHGAGFANICFCKPNTKIIEFKSTKTRKLYENLAISNDLNYKSIRSEPINFISENTFGQINVPIDLLKKIIEDLN